MDTSRFGDVMDRLGELRSTVMGKERTQDGYDLRDEFLELTDIVSELASVTCDKLAEVARHDRIESR